MMCLRSSVSGVRVMEMDTLTEEEITRRRVGVGTCIASFACHFALSAVESTPLALDASKVQLHEPHRRWTTDLARPVFCHLRPP